ncbi:MAG: cytochrome c biogenesis protein CcsA, partial [Actinomycetota bacterium]|nr:cytochrome c biogenesis protein CcsA [Actinomycetota bacterium]
MSEAMLTIGRACLIIALAVSVYGILASIYGARTGRRSWVDSGRRAAFALFAVVALAFGLLEAAFLRSDFAFALVASHSSTTTPLFYRATAVWSSQEGSLLLWLLLLTFWSSVMVRFTSRKAGEIAPYAVAVLLGYGAFFAGLLVFLESPFTLVSEPPSEGNGLNPLLRHPAMMIHPPMLYGGYTLFSIPFALAIGALVAKRLDAHWVRLIRPYALGAWFLLGTGILLGARWSYTELGWGGYWGWDAVENASLLPWLTGTAFLHSVMIQEKRGMLKVWNVSLVLATGILAILGTFIVRSGILESIHAFGASTLGVPFFVLIVGMITSAVGLVIWRAKDLRSDNHLDSLLSREAVFLLNNLLLVGLCFVVFWGTFFPLISEALTGQPASVGPPWFNQYTVPLALILVLLTGIGPAIAWRRVTAGNLRRNMLLPAGAAVVTLVAVVVLSGAESQPAALIMFVFGAFAISVAVQELWRGVRARRITAGESVPRAFVSLVARNRRRYGGYTVHVGITVLFMGVAASSAFKDADIVSLRAGQTVTVGDHQITYVKPTAEMVAARNGRLERIDFGAVLRFERDGKVLSTMETRRSYYPAQDPSLGPVSRFFEGEPTTEVALMAGWRRDVWAAITPNIGKLEPRIAEGDKVFADAADLPPEFRGAALGAALDALTASYLRQPPPAAFNLIVSPLVTWLWLGALISFAGALIALWPGAGARRRATA